MAPCIIGVLLQFAPTKIDRTTNCGPSVLVVLDGPRPEIREYGGIYEVNQCKSKALGGTGCFWPRGGAVCGCGVFHSSCPLSGAKESSGEGPFPPSAPPSDHQWDGEKWLRWDGQAWVAVIDPEQF